MLEINQTYWLDLHECELVRFVANQRQSNKEATGLDGKGTVNERSSVDLNSAGFGAEYLFCKQMNLMPDFSVGNTSKIKGTDLYDAQWNGMTVDVKVSRKHNNPMMIPTYSKCDVKIFAFFVGDLPTYTFKGFATNAMVFDDRNIRMTRVESYVLKTTKMLSLEELNFLINDL
jgi:hypothetical protein